VFDAMVSTYKGVFLQVQVWGRRSGLQEAGPGTFELIALEMPVGSCAFIEEH